MFTSPTSFRLNTASMGVPMLASQDSYGIFKGVKGPPHSSHPDFGHLTLLVFEAVMEVVFVSLPGYIVARQGMFDANAQKFVANLNVMVFTPCLIFTKLASQLNADKLADLAIIPVIFITQILVSWLCSRLMSFVFRFKKRPQNFVTAMAVFGNSNSLPISLVLSLSKTISGLHWDAIPGDNDNEVGARGILYLLIFQQLGQLVRWTWGYNILLKPREEYPEEEQDLLDEYIADNHGHGKKRTRITFLPPPDEERRSRASSLQRLSDEQVEPLANGDGRPTHLQPHAPGLLQTPVNGNYKPSRDEVIHGGASEYGDDHEDGLRTPAVEDSGSEYTEYYPTFKITRPKTRFYRFSRQVSKRTAWISYKIRQFFSKQTAAAWNLLHPRIQKFLSTTWYYTARFLKGFWAFMNPPLWAMVVALIIASVPEFQSLFFTQGTFLNNSIVRAVSQSGGVAVPLILVVLGANLARNTLPVDDPYMLVDEKIETKLLVACLISRMLLPTVIMAPILALIAKYAPISIMDDPIFLIVCFLLTGAPSALQLAQICQINNVYMGAMSKLLFQSYVVWILPSTLILVMCALEVVEWSTGQT